MKSNRLYIGDGSTKYEKWSDKQSNSKQIMEREIKNSWSREEVEEIKLNQEIFLEWLDGKRQLSATKERELLYESVIKKAKSLLRENL